MCAKHVLRLIATSSLITFALLMTLSTSQAQDVMFAPCQPADFEDPSQIAKRMTCLEGRQDELVELVQTLLRSQNDLAQRLDKQVVRLDGKIDGPKKIVERYAAETMAVTIAYWADGAKKRGFDCVPPLAAKPGMTIIGGSLGKLVRITTANMGTYGGFRGCSPPPFCDSGGEFCDIQSRAGGCYVNTEWYNWYVELRQEQGLPISQSDICSG